MKRKYYFVILFLTLTIFFTINTSNVNAKMYKILDSKGNIILVTDNPVLLNKAQEEGYTITPMLEEESIEATQGQILNGQENKQETSSGGEKYDFRKTNWGMSKEQVKETEKGKIVSENEDEVIFRVPDFDDNFECGYSFLENKLYNSTYLFIGEHTNLNDYIDDYERIKEALTKKYGKPIKDTISWKNDLYKNDKQYWGLAIVSGDLDYFTLWETSTTTILLALFGNNYDISLGIRYESKELRQWVVKIREKEKKEKEIKTLEGL